MESELEKTKKENLELKQELARLYSKEELSKDKEFRFYLLEALESIREAIQGLKDGQTKT